LRKGFHGVRLRIACEIIRLVLNLYHKIHLTPKLEAIDGVKLKINPKVFKPKYTLSTELLLKNSFKPCDLAVEVGAGSGALTISLAKNSNEVVSIDIDVNSSRNALENVKLHNLLSKVHVVVADVRFFHLNKKCDLIISNPPYLPLNPITKIDRLWCAGADLSVLKGLVSFAFENLRNGGILKFTCSSLSFQWVKLFLEKNKFTWSITATKQTPLDTILVIEAVKGG